MVIAPIVEGYGEVRAIPSLLHKIARHIAPELQLVVCNPIRRSRSQIVKPRELEKDVIQASYLLEERDALKYGWILLFLDADDDCPATLGPDLRRRARQAREGLNVDVILPMYEYESWILASAQALEAQGLLYSASNLLQPEGVRDAKGRLKQLRPGQRYSETVDQDKLTKKLDITEARQARSFNRFYRICEQIFS